MSKSPVLLLHGGAGSRPLRGERRQEIAASLRRILDSVYPLLANGRSALDAVTEAVRQLEDDPLYNAGYGSKIQSDGHIRMSASIMDGHQRRFGGCVNVEGLKNPIHLARRLMRTKDRVLAGVGAKRFARGCGLPFASPFTAERRREFARKKSGKSGTVGAVALDRFGHLAAATSTGGRGGEYPFRVSDSPTAAGNFANDACAVSATGTGEQIVEQAVAATICAWTQAGWPLERAVKEVLRQGRRTGGDFGLIAVDQDGRFAGQTNTPSLIWAAASNKGYSILGRRL